VGRECQPGLVAGSNERQRSASGIRDAHAGWRGTGYAGLAGETQARRFTASTAVAGLTVKVADTLLMVSAWLVAVTTTVVDEDTVGAVNKPAALIAPAVADQVTPGIEVLPSVALNCCAAP
jgi:hypothetical protein